MPYGALAGTLIFGALLVLTLTAPRRPAWLVGVEFRVASVYNEAPLPFFYLLVIPAAVPLIGGELGTPADLTVTCLTFLVALGFLWIAWQGFRDRRIVEQSLRQTLGSQAVLTKPPLARILFLPFVLRPRSVRRVRNVAYADGGRYNLLDVYHHRSRPENAPVLVYFHGGGFYGGRKSVEGRALLFRLASQGWVTISANYRLRPRAQFFDHLVDAKKVVAWVREHGHEYGGDGAVLLLSGGSAGGTLASIAALTQNQPRYQPGFERVDTSVSAAASLYGWYDGYYELGGPRSEFGVLGHSAEDAPPFFIAHGAKDPLATIETARRFVLHLRESSPNPVIFAELPHGQHGFDLFHSFRFSAVVDGIEAFAAWAGRSADRPAHRH